MSSYHHSEGLIDFRNEAAKDGLNELLFKDFIILICPTSRDSDLFKFNHIDDIINAWLKEIHVF